MDSGFSIPMVFEIMRAEEYRGLSDSDWQKRIVSFFDEGRLDEAWTLLPYMPPVLAIECIGRLDDSQWTPDEKQRPRWKQCSRYLPLSSHGEQSPLPLLTEQISSANPGEIDGLALSGNGQILAAASCRNHSDGKKGLIEFWKLSGREKIGEVDTGFGRGIRYLSFHPEEELLVATGSNARQPSIMVSKGGVISPLPGTEVLDEGSDFHPGGNQLAMAGEKEIAILPFPKGRKIRSVQRNWRRHQKFSLRVKGLADHFGHLGPPCFSPDGHHLAVPEFDGTVSVVNTSSWRKLKDLRSKRRNTPGAGGSRFDIPIFTEFLPDDC